MLPLLLWLACDSPSDTGPAALSDDCARACIDSSFHLCGGYTPGAQTLDCSALAGGVTVDGLSEWKAYQLLAGADEVASLRVGDTLTASCSGSVELLTWTVSGTGCAMVEAIPLGCDQLSQGIAHDSDAVGVLVEAETDKGWQTLTPSLGANVVASCPAGASGARVVSVLEDVADIGR